MAQEVALDLLLYFASLVICIRTNTVLAVVRVTGLATDVVYFGSSALEENREFCRAETCQPPALLLIQREDRLPPVS